MRDRRRIRPLLARLAAVWEAHPDLRLGQLLHVAGDDLYHLECAQLVEALEEKLGKGDPHVWATTGRRLCHACGASRGTPGACAGRQSEPRLNEAAGRPDGWG